MTNRDMISSSVRPKATYSAYNPDNVTGSHARHTVGGPGYSRYRMEDNNR
jgi:hypothetical protein